MEQLVILLIIGLISLVNWLMQKAAEKREARAGRRVEKREVKRETRRNIYTQPAPAAPAPPARRGPAGRDPFKDLMDALGLPPEETPPGPVVAEPDFFPEDAEFIPFEEAAPPPLPEPVVVPARVTARKPPAKPKRPDRRATELASAFAAFGEEPGPTYRGSSVRDLLDSRDSKRKAVILAEILGTPRGLAASSALMTRGHL
jgi:hypothetical protein